MISDQIIEFAQQATRYANDRTDAEGYNWDLIRDEHFANLVAQYEREQCAKLCEQQDEQNTQYRYDYRRGVLDCADAIRQRGNQ